MMSLADFNDIYMICKEWETETVFEDVIITGLNGLSTDSLTYKLTSRTNRWAEIPEKENVKREVVLI